MLEEHRIAESHGMGEVPCTKATVKPVGLCSGIVTFVKGTCGGSEEGDGLPGRLHIVGYLGYFNSLDEFEGYQPCGCLYPLFRRFAPEYWRLVTSKL